jgi:sarcosine oxidase subunit beta
MTDLPPSTDFLVIGGGIAGVSLAWHLAKRRAGRVTLIEKSVIAAGASGKTGALLRRHYSNRPEAILAQAGWETYAHWPEVVGGDPVHAPGGLVVTIPAGPGFEANIDRLHRNIALQNAVGIPARAITAAELQALEPRAVVDDLIAAYEPDSGAVDAIAATHGMARAAQAAGATIHEACPALEIVTNGDQVRGVRTASGVITAETVICVAGPWSPRLLATAGVHLPLEALRVQVVILQRPLAFEPAHHAYIDTVAGLFCRPWGPGRTLIGISGGDQHEPVDPDCYDPHLDPGYPAQAIATMARRFPIMAGAVALHGHAGLYDMSPDAHPILGPAGPDGLSVMAGFSGAGFKKAPAAAQALAELLLDGRSSLVDLHPFRLDRFATDAWRAPWSDSEYVLSSNFGHGF